MDLYLPLSPGRRRDQLEQRLREGIRAGRLPAGTALPSSRALAAELGVSRGVVVEAYAQLIAEGWLVAHQGTGTRIADTTPGALVRSEDRLGDEPSIRRDLRTGRPDLSAFPRRAWASALTHALREAPDAALDYGDPRGTPELRHALTAHLGRVRGVVANPALVVVCAGTAAGLPLIWRALRARGARRVAVEDPGWREQAVSARLAGLEAVPVPVDGSGLVAEALDGLGVDAVCVTPAHQFPTGVVLAPERRAALVAWARRCGALVVEDDYDAEYRYDREPVGALQGLAPDVVVYAGSASKTLAPALRLGWLVVSADLAEPVAATAARGTPVLEQLALARLIERGELARHLRRTRKSYRARRDTLVAALGDRFALSGIAAGLHVVAQTSEATELAVRVRREGVAVHTLHGDCFVAASRPAALLLGYARETAPSLTRAAQLLTTRS